MSDDKPMDRRRFFRRGLSELIKPIASAISPLERAARKIGDMEGPPSRYPLNVWLRPPGALPEKQFKQTCTRGGECVKVCPAHCIKIDPTGIKGDGVPYIDIDSAACVVCDGLQ